MAIKANTPAIATLLAAIEQKFGRPVRTPSDFILVADSIEASTHEHISDSTVKRLWKPSLGYDTISERTMNVLSQYMGFSHYDAFLSHLKSIGGVESELVEEGECVKVRDLSPGDIVTIAWMPDRECRLRYLGDRKFEAIECHHSKLKEGDTFQCSTFLKGRALYVDNFTHNGKVYAHYGMGTDHGLTRAEIEKL